MQFICATLYYGIEMDKGEECYFNLKDIFINFFKKTTNESKKFIFVDVCDSGIGKLFAE